MITILSSTHFLCVFCFLYRPVKGDKRTKSRDGSSSGRSVAKPRKADSTRLVYPELLGILEGGFVLPLATFNMCTTKLYQASFSQVNQTFQATSCRDIRVVYTQFSRHLFSIFFLRKVF